MAEMETLKKCVRIKSRFKLKESVQPCRNYIPVSTCATTCDFQQCGVLTSVDSDEPVHPPFKLRNSKCYSVSSLTVI